MAIRADNHIMVAREATASFKSASESEAARRRKMKIYKWTLAKTDPKDFEADFDTFSFRAPNEKEAWKIVFGLSGENGIPLERQYDLKKGPVDYEFDGDIDAWYEAVRRGDVLGR